MSDQLSSSPPPKPKPGSLRDRIAAFEKSATAPTSAGQAPPPPRPKPSGFASWKPKVPSPPSSPSSKTIDHAASPSLKASGTMSAYDAKESIKGGGGSLKERMAALQGKGAFGAPSPPLAPKPAAEKPRWKPPPAVAAPIDYDNHDGTSDESSKPIAEEEATSTALSTEGGIEGTTDPEEEEQQRRAAIAARMARLGGARLGMAPPVVAKKPPMPIRKPTREDVPKQEDREELPKRRSITLEGNISLPSNAEQGATVASANLTDSPHVQPQSDVELFPVRKNSESASILSVDSTDSNATRSPPSMPVPMVPRRAGPPRKKPVKSTPEVPEVSEERAEEVIATPPVISEPEHQAIPAPEHKDLDHKDHHEIYDEPQSIDSGIQHKPAEELVADSKSASSGELQEQGPTHDATIEASNEIKQEQDHEHEHEHRTDQPEDDEIIDSSDEHSNYDETHSVEHHDDHVGAEPQPSSVVDATGTEEDEEDAAEEEARRTRIAERLAKMGGITPFAAPLLSPPLPPSSEETGHADPPVVSSPASRRSYTLPESPSRPDIPTRRASLPSHEVAKPHALPIVESKVEEEQGEREISDEIEEEDNDVYAEEGSSHETRILKPMEESSSAAYELPPPPPPLLRHYQQAETAPVHQLPDAILRPPIPGSARPHVQIQQYGRHDEHSVTRPSRLPDPLVGHEEASLSPTRPAQPPRRIVPQAPEEEEQGEEEEEDEEAGTDDEVVPSHLFVRPPVEATGLASRHLGRDDGDCSENDTPALPVLQRRSIEVPSGRTIPPPAPPSHLHLPTSSSDVYEPDSDHDGQALPVRPRHTAAPLTPIPSAPIPLRPTPRRSVPSALENGESFYVMPSVAVSEPEPGEILDEEEGDPIDPAFHSPSRRASVGNMRAAAQDDTSGPPVQAPSAPPVNVEKREEVQQQQEQDQTKRQTLAERMAKLGGIKFGTAAIPAVNRPPPPTAPGVDGSHSHPEDEEQSVEPSEEEEERARKERIAAKLAGMGGMRIGMMPMGMGPQRAYTLRDENVAPPSPTRAAPPPIRPPPPILAQTQDTDSERISDDGVKVEAEESEMEEVDYADVAEELEEAPPVPSRARRRESTDKTTSPPPPPSLIPGIRPPVPVIPTRRASMQTSKSTGSVESGSRPTSSQIFSQSEYVIVDEPQGHEEGTPPSRRTSRINPIRPPRNPRASQTFDSRSISSHWELPTIPTPAIDFGGGADLSLSSWTDAGEPTSPSVSSPPPPPPPAKEPRPSDLQLSADDLMTMWGRVGVQVCEVATSLFENSKKTLIGDGTYAGFVTAVLAGVPNATPISAASGEYGYLVYAQSGTLVQKRVSEIMPGDIVEIHEGKLKGHKGIQMYHQNVGGSGEALLGIVGEFEAKKSKIRVFHANQHVGQQTVESVSYRLEDLKSGTVKVYRVLEQ